MYCSDRDCNEVDSEEDEVDSEEDEIDREDELEEQVDTEEEVEDEVAEPELIPKPKPIPRITKNDLKSMDERIRILNESKKSFRPFVPVSLAVLRRNDIVQVQHLSRKQVLEEIKKLNLPADIHNVADFTFQFASRDAGNTEYIPRLRRTVLKNKIKTRSLTNSNTHVTTKRMAVILKIINQAVEGGFHVTKRGVFYQDVPLFVKQENINGLFCDVSCLLKCQRQCLNILASHRSLVAGHLIYSYKNKEFDCSFYGGSLGTIPTSMEDISIVSSDAFFLLIIEKEATFSRLVEDGFHNKYKCIMVTSKGYPDLATRMFVRKIVTELKIPVYGLFDCDPHGLAILATYSSGSKAMAYDSENLAIPEIRWIGLRPKDIQTFGIPSTSSIPFTAKDIKTCEDSLLKEGVFEHVAEWKDELLLMIRTGKKYEIQALEVFGPHYLAKVFLPYKLQIPWKEKKKKNKNKHKQTPRKSTSKKK